MAVDPSMMGAGPMIPPVPTGNTMGMGLPAAPTPPAPAATMTAPAAEALPGLAQLAQQQTMQIMEHERQMMQMQEQMQKEIMLLIASLPTPNPAGEAAVSTPTPPMMNAPSDQMGY